MPWRNLQARTDRHGWPWGWGRSEFVWATKKIYIYTITMIIIYTHRSYICKYMEIIWIYQQYLAILTVFGSFGACGSAMSGDSFVGLFMKNEPGSWTQIMFRPLGPHSIIPDVLAKNE
jgi:hypothetical protein